MKTNRYKLKILLTSVAVFSTLVIDAQSFLPITSQFTKKDYMAGSQNWAVEQGTDRIIYFGNAEGLLVYDGWNFSLIKMPKNQVVRSIFINKQNRIYVGSFEEFGYFEKDALGNYKYTSISSKLKNYKMKNDEIWSIIEFQGKIVFQSFTSIFVWDGKNVTGKRYDFTFMYLQNFNNQLYIYVHKSGFCKYNLTSQQFTSLRDVPFHSSVIKILPINDKFSYVVTESEGIYSFDGTSFKKFQTNAEDWLSKWGVNKAVLTNDSLIVVGSIQNGVAAFNLKGQKLWDLNTTGSLLNNTVLGMYCDNENNVWLALDRGISKIDLGSSLRMIASFSPSIGSIYSVAYQNSKLFLATNQGLYRANLSLAEKKISGIELDRQIKGQIWNIFSADNQLFCGNNDATFEILPNGANRTIPSSKGGMCMCRGKIYNTDVLVQGTYNEICIYTKQNNRWEYSHSIANFYNPINTIQIDFQGNIWASHMHNGLYKITLKEDLTTIDKIVKYNSLNGTKELPIKVYSINNRVLFSDNTAFYIYDDLHNKIIPFTRLNESLGRFQNSHNVCHCKSNAYWFIDNDAASLVQIRDNNVSIVDRIFLTALQNQTVDYSECMIPIENDNFIITLENGLALYTLNNKKHKVNLPELRLQSVETRYKNTYQISFLNLSDHNVHVSNNQNSLTFTLAFPVYSTSQDIKFRYRLDGLNSKWGTMTSSNKKQYEYLIPGTYTFMAEAFNSEGKKVGKLMYKFYVNPPFYWSPVAKLFYFILFLISIYLIIQYYRRRYNKKKAEELKEQERLQKIEIEKREQQILTLKNDKLESELSLKSKDLAASTMSLIKKNQLLNTIKQEINFLKDKLGTQYPNKYYDKLVKLLDDNISSEDDWNVFQANFDRIHDNFFRNLHQRYPQLTSNDLRLCAYLRLNLSTKDIAHLMNISPKGVEVGRYRIRKKMDIPSTKSLTEFMIEFK